MEPPSVTSILRIKYTFFGNVFVYWMFAILFDVKKNFQILFKLILVLLAVPQLLNLHFSDYYGWMYLHN